MKEHFNFAYTTDLLIFGINSRVDNIRALPEKSLSLLLVKRTKEPYKDKWCLPGGFILKDETSKEATKRILKKETGLSNVYMNQVRVNDDVNRDPRGRVISISYMALIDRTLLKEKLNTEACWFDLTLTSKDNKYEITLTNEQEIITYQVKKNIIDQKASQYSYQALKNDLSFDHAKLIIEGLMELRNKVKNTDIVFNLMPEYFTIGELKQVYEILLGKKLINSAFRRVIADRLIVTNEIIKTGGHRPSQLCKYKGE